jgi:hypothetical protein
MRAVLENQNRLYNINQKYSHQQHQYIYHLTYDLTGNIPVTKITVLNNRIFTMLIYLH